MVDVVIPTTDGRELVLPRYTCEGRLKSAAPGGLPAVG